MERDGEAGRAGAGVFRSPATREGSSNLNQTLTDGGLSTATQAFTDEPAADGALAMLPVWRGPVCLCAPHGPGQTSGTCLGCRAPSAMRERAKS